MAKLIYAMNVSLDGYMEDEHVSLEWSILDDEVFEFWTDFQKSLDTYLYGHRFYDSMVYWETYDIHNTARPEKPENSQKFGGMPRKSCIHARSSQY